MRLKNVFSSLFIFSFSFNSQAVPPRIGRTIIDKSVVQKLYITPGRSSILIFPCNVKTFSSGPTNDITALLNERDSKILEVWLSNSSNQPAGLKIICNDNLFAFDVIPSKNTHQDFLEVKGSYGTPVSLDEADNHTHGTVLMSSRDIQKTAADKSRRPRVIRIISSSKGEKKNE